VPLPFMTSIARKNLFEDIPRFLVAQAGIMFAVSLVTIQTGILKGFTHSTTLLIDHSEADIWVTSKDMVQLELTLPLTIEQLSQAQKISGVERAEAFVFRSALWRNAKGQITPVRVVGFEPRGQLFRPWNITQGQMSELQTPYSVMVDATNLDTLGLRQLGDRGTLGSFPARLVGSTQGTQSIVSSTFVFTSLENANAYLNSQISSTLRCQSQVGSDEVTCSNTYETPSTATTTPLPPTPRRLNLADSITYILVRAQPGQDLSALKQRLEATLPDTRALTRSEMARQTRDYWQKRTGIGFILGLGATVGVIVGVIIVGQILYSSVSDHIREFGTLKAMGASDWVIYGVIVEQALWMAVLGYLPSLLLCWGVSTWTAASQGILILITPVTAFGVFGITVVMCVSSALFAIQKVTRVDPAIVFKA
jgi:putative ABC transport system permease protein